MPTPAVYYTPDGLPPNGGRPPAQDRLGDIRSMPGAPWPSSLVRFTGHAPAGPGPGMMPLMRQASVPLPTTNTHATRARETEQTMAWLRTVNALQQQSASPPVQRPVERVTHVNHVVHCCGHQHAAPVPEPQIHHCCTRTTSTLPPAPVPAPAPTLAPTAQCCSKCAPPAQRSSQDRYYCVPQPTTPTRPRQAPPQPHVCSTPAPAEPSAAQPALEVNVVRLGRVRDYPACCPPKPPKQVLQTYSVDPNQTIAQLFEDLEMDSTG